MNNSIYVLEKKLLTSDRDRFLNCIIDFFSILIMIFVFTFFVVITGNIFQWDVYRPWVETMINLGMLGTYLSFAMFYYLVFESLFGRTIGKFITGSIVVNENGLKPSFSAICIRTLCRLIPFDQLSFLSKSERIWHDALSKTFVVEKKDLERDMEIFRSLDLIGKKEIA
ncbi:RDD family protein [Flavobacterium sp. KACC 22761]|uniref:RDD family protein n=1 Tax=Flavobacterium sp. KACC 22761 TaxID=3092665 RepID=UPI002A74D41C|nr:RDD family protein [Flavobacterium sp. KACC 22761]WPO80572.1 RDD family protein [Flavobacterium sp. KACC 22761]